MNKFFSYIWFKLSSFNFKIAFKVSGFEISEVILLIASGSETSPIVLSALAFNKACRCVRISFRSSAYVRLLWCVGTFKISLESAISSYSLGNIVLKNLSLSTLLLGSSSSMSVILALFFFLLVLIHLTILTTAIVIVLEVIIPAIMMYRYKFELPLFV